MEKEQAKKILDDIAKSLKTMMQHENYICSDVNAIHMSNSLREMATAMGLEVAEKSWECDGSVATHISFVYKDILFFQLENFRKRDEDAGKN